MKKLKKIYVVACLHGDEVFGLKVLAHLQSRGDDNITTLIAHPEAVAKRKRCLESDLNRSFHPSAAPTKEVLIARRIRKEIDRLKPDLIVDLHTVGCPVGPVAILAQDDDQLLQFAAQLGMKRAVIMPEHIAKDSLIGRYPERALSLEFGSGLRSDKLAMAVADAIIAASHGNTAFVRLQMPVYHVTRKIANDEVSAEELTNYEYHPGLQGYPFLTGGKDAYTDFRGFLATKHSLRQVAINQQIQDTKDNE